MCKTMLHLGSLFNQKVFQPPSHRVELGWYLFKFINKNQRIYEVVLSGISLANA